MVVAIDGPAGAGKRSVSLALARDLGFTWFHTGSMYRAVGLLTLREGGAASEHAERLEIEVGERVLVRDEDVTELLHSPEVTEAAARVATNMRVRAALADKQRALLTEGDWVVVGRDIGTVVMPDAPVKIFLTASPEERARRRAEELGLDADTVLRDQALRDAEALGRPHSPLQMAPDALALDTTGMPFDEVVERIVALVREAS